MDVAISEIRIGKNEIREVKDDEAMDDLVASVRRIGIVQPLVVSKGDEGYILVAGHRRYRAAQICKLESVPVIVQSDGSGTAEEVAFAENLFRKDLSAVETASAIKDVLQQEVMSVEEMARVVHRSTEWVRRMVAMCDWPTDVLLAVHNGQVSVAAGSNLALITEDTYREFLVRNAVEHGATARTTAAWLQAWRSMQPPEQAVMAPPVDGSQQPIPLIPQAPCMCCGQVFRQDALSHVPVCVGCVKILRDGGV